MAVITGFPVELVARIFEEMEVGDAWVARGVCRFWYNVFEYGAYGSRNVYLSGTRIGVDVVCSISSEKGLQDSHVVQGDLSFANDSSGDARMARWVCEENEYVYWPGGNWRMFAIGEVLTEVNVQFKYATSTTKTDVTVCLGQNIALSENIKRRDDDSAVRNGKFQEFSLSIDEREEGVRSGKTYNKHCVLEFTTPKWQMYSLLSHHAKLEREKMESRHRHYVQSWHNIYKYSSRYERRRSMGTASEWI
jgi:hypothetical protein